MSLAGALTTTAGAGRAIAAEPRRGGTLALLLSAEPPTISAVAHTAYNTVIVAAKVQEGLLTYDFNLTPKPQLAVSWDVAEDGLSYAFKLRPGVKWHDGKDFTSADVAFSITALKSVHPRGRSTFANVSEIRTPDPLTVILALAKPAPYLLSAFAAAESPIVPKHIYEQGGPVDANPANNAPIGTGPFVFKEWVRGSHILYERNPNYWDAGKPYIDRLIVRIIPDAAARVAAIETGEIQLAPNSPIPLSDAERLKALPGLGFETNGYQYTNTISRVEFNLDRPVFKDVRVRRAFAHAIDRKVIRDVVNYGYGRIIVGPISASLAKFYVDDLKTYPFDPKEAERLLDEAGYRRGSDGVRFRLTHDYVPSGDLYRRGADYIKQALSRIGVEVTVRAQDFPSYTKRVYTDRDFDFTFNGMSNLFDPTVGVQRLYWSKNFKPGVPFSNGSHYANPEVDRLLETAATELDPKKRYDHFVAFQRILAEDLPDFGILSSGEFTIFSRSIDGHTIGADGVSGNLADVHFVKQRERPMTDALDLDRPAAARPDPRDEARRLAHLFSGSAAELDRSGAFPRANIEALSAAGLLNLVIGREHGGHGAGLRLARDIISEIARGEPSTALIVAMHYLNHAAIRYSRRWPDHLARQLVRDSLCGPALVNALQVEPGAGSPSYGTLPRTIARRTETGWRLTGRKTFATGCEGLAWFIVLAVTDEPQPRIGSFVVSHLSPGIHIERTWDTVGMRATGSHDVTFRDIAVPHADVLDLAPASEGIRRDEQQTAWFMLLIGAVYHGIALAARDDVLAFALDFRPGDLKEPLSSLPRIQDELGAIEVLLISNERLLNSVARDFDEDVPIGPDSGAVRHAVIENAIRVVDLALTIAGNAGVSRNHALERHHRNVICGRTHAPTGPLVRAAAARAAISRAVKTRTAST